MTVSKLTLTCQLFAASAGLWFGSPNPVQAFQVTADEQKSNRADRELTQKIRQSLVADKSLSTSAHNVKIVSRDGQVTLEGKVKSEDEKNSIEDKAIEVAGAGKVTNDLTVSSR